MEFNLHYSKSLRLLLFFAIFSTVLIDYAKASDDVTNPRSNTNLNPIQQWRSAVECMMYNKSMWCSEQQQLSLNLTIEVSQEEIDIYCKKGCLEHTLGVLDCIHDVKRDFWFANDFDTWTLRSFLINRCANLTGFSYKDIQQSGAIQVSQKNVLSIIIPIFALVYMNNNLHYIM